MDGAASAGYFMGEARIRGASLRMPVAFCRDHRRNGSGFASGLQCSSSSWGSLEFHEISGSLEGCLKKLHMTCHPYSG